MMRLLIVWTVAILAISCAPTETLQQEAKYIFYFIGDGMSSPQVALCEAALSVPQFRENYTTQTGVAERDYLYMNALNITGFATTYAENRYITDSAAAGTALATGNKTDVGVISQTPEGKGLQTIAEMAKQRGMKVGIVSSVSIDHATPASFYAHTPSRNNYTAISNQLLSSSFDYFAGGSVKWDKRATTLNVDKAKAYSMFRGEAEARGFNFTTTRAELESVTSEKPVIATLDMLSRGLYTADGSSMPYTIDLHRHQDDDRITLADFTRRGVELLENPDGFFMMVEGGKIDWACHANDAATTAYEVLAFDEAVGVALEFAERYPEQTLIIVTGDHETGGLALGFAGTRYESAFEVLAAAKISYEEFSVLAHQRLSQGESFEGILKFACQEFGLVREELTPYEVNKLRSAYAKSTKREGLSADDVYHGSYGDYDPFTTTLTNFLNHRAGVDFTSYSHTALPVAVFAQGAGEELFSGYYDNTDIPKMIIQAAGFSLE